MSFHTKSRFASHAFEQSVQVTFGELDYLVARRADQVMTVRGLRRSVTMAAVVQVHPAQRACLDQNL
jgi:hypothetical protein